MKDKKYFFTIILVVMTLFLVACNNEVGNNELGDAENNLILDEDKEKNENEASNNEENENSENVVIENEEGKLFYFVASKLIAVSEKGVIRPVEDENGKKLENITLNELLSEDFYTEYTLLDDRVEVDKINNVKIADFYGDHEAYSNKIAENLIKYGKKIYSDISSITAIEYDVYEIDLPMQINPEISDMDVYYKIGDNGYGSEIELGRATDNALLTNAKFNINFEAKAKDNELSDNVENELRKYIDDNGLSNDLKYSCINKFVTDLEGDNVKERIYLVETQDFDSYDSDISKTGAFSLILIERENNEVEIVYESIIKPFEYTDDSDFSEQIMGTTTLPKVFIADIDNDNDKEIIVEALLLEPEPIDITRIYALNGDKYYEAATYYSFGL